MVGGGRREFEFVPLVGGYGEETLVGRDTVDGRGRNEGGNLSQLQSTIHGVYLLDKRATLVLNNVTGVQSAG